VVADRLTTRLAVGLVVGACGGATGAHGRRGVSENRESLGCRLK
jgi:hypothetical protein